MALGRRVRSFCNAKSESAGFIVTESGSRVAVSVAHGQTERLERDTPPEVHRWRLQLLRSVVRAVPLSVTLPAVSRHGTHGGVCVSRPRREIGIRGVR